VNRLVRFVNKPVAEKQRTLRFFARKALSRLPFAPILCHFQATPAETVEFWWSYVSDVNHPERPMSEYWGDDCGELRFLWQFLRPGNTFFDVGSYHGIFSILAAKKVGPRGRVVAFEASPREQRRLAYHLRMNELSTVQCEARAISSGRGTTTFFTVVDGHTTMNSMHVPPIGSTREITVETRSLDDYLEEHRIDSIDLMKVDIEGGELEAFSGAQRLLKKVRPVMICEVLDWVTRPWGYPARKIIDYLQGMDYEWFDFSPDGTIRAHAAREHYPEVQNYLAVPREKASTVEGWLRR
jgi:FkbM family methyltransferase